MIKTFKLMNIIYPSTVNLMKLVTVKMPDTYIEGLDELVKSGRYSSRSEAIRVAVRDLLRRELWQWTESYVKA